MEIEGVGLWLRMTLRLWRVQAMVCRVLRLWRLRLRLLALAWAWLALIERSTLLVLMWVVQCMSDIARPGIGTVMMLLLRRCICPWYLTLCERHVILIAHSTKLGLTT